MHQTGRQTNFHAIVRARSLELAPDVNTCFYPLSIWTSSSRNVQLFDGLFIHDILKIMTQLTLDFIPP